MRNSRGFTLIEILIVIVIIGITVGFALLAFGDFGASRRAQFALEQLEHALQLAQQQAILEVSTLGLRVEKNGYQILKLQPNHQWQVIADKGIFKFTAFPKNTVIHFKSALPNKGHEPEIIINASGDMTPFSLSLGAEDDSNSLVLHGSADGSLSLTKAESK